MENDKFKVKIFNINLNQGLLLNERNTDSIVGIFDHQKKEVRFKIPYDSSFIILPDSLESYTKINQSTDLIGLQYWTEKGFKSL